MTRYSRISQFGKLDGEAMLLVFLFGKFEYQTIYHFSFGEPQLRTTCDFLFGWVCLILKLMYKPSLYNTSLMLLQLKELESKHKSFDNQLREEIGKISQKSESYHQFRETYSFVSISTDSVLFLIQIMFLTAKYNKFQVKDHQ